MAARKPPVPGETGVPVPRNGFLSGLKTQNGHTAPKMPLGSPSPRLSTAPTPLPTILDEPGKKVKKSAPLQHLSPPLKTSPGSHGAGSRGDSHRPGSWDGRAAGLSTSPKLVPAATANGHRDRAASSPEHSGSSDPAQGPSTPRSGAARSCDSQGRTPIAGSPRAPLNGEASTVGKPRPPALSNVAAEPANAMSPPPAKKLALSAKKASPLRRAPGTDRAPPLPPLSDLTHPRKATHPAAACARPVGAARAVSPTPRPPGLPKPPHAATLASSLPNSASAPPPQVNGGCRAPPHQPEASGPLQSLCRKRKRKRLGEALRPGSEPGEAAAPPGKRRRKKRKRPEDADMAPGQEGQVQGQHRSPERRREGSVQPPASPGLGPNGGQQPENGRGLVNGWPGGCKSDSPHVSKKRRKGGEGEACPPQDPPGHRSCSPSGAEPDATAASPRKKKKKRRKLGSQREGEDREHPEGWGGPALSASNPTPAVGSQGPGGPEGPEPAPRHSGTRESGASVVWELLGCAADGAYGRKVLTWGGEVSAVSLDAMQDRRVARASTVVDDWDEEFDRGKEKKIKKLKRERKRNFNAFQKLQNRRNFWSVTHPAKAASLSYRR